MTEPQDSPSDPVAPTEKTLDTKTVEVLALTVFRAIFGKGVRVPLKMNGVTDMDLVVRDDNVILNLNKVQLRVPELLIWRFIFAYQGKPVLEYGRGIKNDMKIHLPQVFFLLLAVWRERRKKYKAKATADAARDREMVIMSTTDPKAGKTEDTTS